LLQHLKGAKRELNFVLQTDFVLQIQYLARLRAPNFETKLIPRRAERSEPGRPGTLPPIALLQHLNGAMPPIQLDFGRAANVETMMAKKNKKT